jgi:hypothetical protein
MMPVVVCSGSGLSICTVTADGVHVAADVPAPKNTKGDDQSLALAVVLLIEFAALIDPIAQTLLHSLGFTVAPSGRLNAPKTIHAESD